MIHGTSLHDKVFLRGSKGEAIMMERESVLCGWQESGKVVSAEQIAMYVFGGNEERRRSIVIYTYNNDGH